jgi:diazepam-binding inhibitor (GABA receptor modulating acyl-CoA-binding protein)
MSDLKMAFEKAQNDINNIAQKPSNDVLLKLYSLYKQGSEGDVSGKRPGMTDFKGRAKYDAWGRLKSTSNEKAMEDYIALVESLR